MRRLAFPLAIVLATSGLAVAQPAIPPDRLNYQGVLRDASGNALDGTFDMIFRYYDTDGGATCPALGGTELRNEAFNSGTAAGPVTVTDGLFNVTLGTGGFGGASLWLLFRDHDEVWLEVQVEGERLCPRTRIIAAPYSLNARHLNGLSDNQLLRSDTSQTFTGGALTLNTSGGPGLVLEDYEFWTSSATDEELRLANRGTGGMNMRIDDDLFVGVRSSTDTDRIRFDDLNGNEMLMWYDIGDRFFFSNDLHLKGVLRTGNDTNGGSTQTYNVMKAGSGAPVPGSGFMGDAGDLFVEGDVEIDGIGVFGGQIRLLDGSFDQNQEIYFYDGNSPTGEFLQWNDGSDRFEISNDLSIDDDLTVNGLDIRFGSDSRIQVDPGSVNDFFIRKDEDNNHSSWFRIFEDGNTIEQMRIGNGDEASALFDGTVTSNGLDYAEAFYVTPGSSIEPGDVVGLDPARPEHIVLASTSGVSTPIGVVSANPGYLTGMSFDAEETVDAELCELRDAARARGALKEAREMTERLTELVREANRPVALIGRVPVKVVGTNGPIAAGDRLTASDVPGHAMRQDAPGPSIGIALESWSGDPADQVLTFIQPGWYGGVSVAPSAAAPEDGDSATADLADKSESGAVTLSGQPSFTHEVLLGGGPAGRTTFTVVDAEVDDRSARELFRVSRKGDVFARGAFRPAAMDVAEYFPLSEPALPGDVLAIDPDDPGRYRLASEASSPLVVGVVSQEPGVLLGSDVAKLLAADAALAAELELAEKLGDGEEEDRIWRALERRFSESHAAVALTGTVSVKVDAGYGEIRPGDLLTSSPTPGHAMRADDPQPGTVIGKALQGLEAGLGEVRILVASPSQ